MNHPTYRSEQQCKLIERAVRYLVIALLGFPLVVSTAMTVLDIAKGILP